MNLWFSWFTLVQKLRPSCKRTRTFFWMISVLIGITIRSDLLGVTSIIRALGIRNIYYDRILDFFHSSSLSLTRLTHCWISIVLQHIPLLTINNRIIIVGDGLKVAKSGKKMPGVKRLHQESESNTKPTYINGHSFQSISVLSGSTSVFAVPLVSRIHEGVKYTNRDKRTLIDKMMELLHSVSISHPYYFVADAYYASKKVICSLLQSENHLISRVRMNAVAYHLPKAEKRRRGAPRKYGKKVYLRSLFDNTSSMKQIKSMMYDGSKTTLQYQVADLVWKGTGTVVRFVIVIHPHKGRAIFMCTDTHLSAEEIIKIYSLRFKIEVSFKQVIRTIGGYAYHFWMKNMKPISKKGNVQYLHRESDEYREKVKKKIDTYHRYIQLGLIAQGLLMYLSSTHTHIVWKYFGSWIRTIRPEVLPSEMITAMAMKNTVFEFFYGSVDYVKYRKFILDKIDLAIAGFAKLMA